MNDLGVDMCGSFDHMQNLEVRTLQSESMGSQSVAKHEESTLNNVITCLYSTASLTSSDILHIIECICIDTHSMEVHMFLPMKTHTFSNWKPGLRSNPQCHWLISCEDLVVQGHRVVAFSRCTQTEIAWNNMSLQLFQLRRSDLSWFA